MRDVDAPNVPAERGVDGEAEVDGDGDSVQADARFLLVEDEMAAAAAAARAQAAGLAHAPAAAAAAATLLGSHSCFLSTRFPLHSRSAFARAPARSFLAEVRAGGALRPVEWYSPRAFLGLDEMARRNLELVRSARTGRVRCAPRRSVLFSSQAFSVPPVLTAALCWTRSTAL